MGIEGLWSELAPLRQSCSLNQFRGKRIGVDAANVFLHPLARHFSLELAQGDISGLVSLIQKKILAIQRRSGVNLVLVFDGEEPPAKKEESRLRDQQRSMMRSIGIELLKYGRTVEARKILEKAPTIGRFSELIASKLAMVCEVIFAPVEAEAQLASMARAGSIAAAWSGDSDVVAYWAPKVLRDVHLGTLKGELYDFGSAQANWRSVGALGNIQNHELFALCCAACGSDYTPHFNKPIQRVARLLSPCRDLAEGMKQLTEHFRLSARDQKLLNDATYAMVHHWIYDERSGDVACNFPVPSGEPDEAILGRRLSPREATNFCVRRHQEVDPRSIVSLVDEEGLEAYQPKAVPEGFSRTDGAWACESCGVTGKGDAAKRQHEDGGTHQAVALLMELRRRRRATA